MSDQQVPRISLIPAEMYHALTVAHAEIARLRLTDEEREAVKAAVDFCECTDKPLPRPEQIATLRGLSERMK